MARPHLKPAPITAEPTRCACGCGAWVLPHVQPRDYASGACRARACYQRKRTPAQAKPTHPIGDPGAA